MARKKERGNISAQSHSTREQTHQTGKYAAAQTDLAREQGQGIGKSTPIFAIFASSVLVGLLAIWLSLTSRFSRSAFNPDNRHDADIEKVRTQESHEHNTRVLKQSSERRIPSLQGDQSPCSSPLAALVQGVANASFLDQVQDMVTTVMQQQHPPVVQRNFGVDSTYLKGHQAIHLKDFALKNKRWLVDELFHIVSKADAWDLLKRSSSVHLRCLELIEYHAEEHHSLALHNDGCTILTTALMLSTLGTDFQGGRVHFSQREKGQVCTEVKSLSLGDVLAWRGGRDHGVEPVTRGVRRVLVAEWWADPMPQDGVGRPVDTEVACQEAARLDHSSDAVHTRLAELLGESGRTAEAEVRLSSAVQLNPLASDVQMNLGIYLAQRGQVAEAEARMMAALQVEPSGIAALKNLGMFFTSQERFSETLHIQERMVSLGHFSKTVRK